MQLAFEHRAIREEQQLQAAEGRSDVVSEGQRARTHRETRALRSQKGGELQLRRALNARRTRLGRRTRHVVQQVQYERDHETNVASLQGF